MLRRQRKSFLVALGAAATVTLASGIAPANEPPDWARDDKEPAQGRTHNPEDRFALAGGCYVISSRGGYLARSDGGGFTGVDDASDAEPFMFKATDLGSYLLFAAQADFLAASEGLLGQAAYGATRTQAGAIAGGVSLDHTTDVVPAENAGVDKPDAPVGNSDEVADRVARSDANRAAGRGASVIAAPEPSELADWTIDGPDGGPYMISLPATNQELALDGDALVLVETGAGDAFTFDLAAGCAEFPEVDINIDGPVVGGATAYQEVRGFLELHLHMMAFEFIGGRVRCGRPWHRYGAPRALVDCPDHEPRGFGAVLEGVLSNGGPDGRHNTDGWPTFEGWPKFASLTHEQVYYRWLERAWRGGLRLMTNLLVDNNQLCKVYPFKRNSCNEMDGVRLQARRIHELQDYIDAQSGGPGEGWFRIVTDPFQAREVINDGKLAVVLGIEVSVPLDCSLHPSAPECTPEVVDERLQEVYDLGVRQMELVNKFDNQFSGVTGDGGLTGPVVNVANFGETGSFWKMDGCDDHANAEHSHDKTQPNFHDDSGAPDEFSGRDSIFGAVLALLGQSGAAPVYGGGPHCNTIGLSELGKTMIAEMAERGMIFDPDHMSARARSEALDFIATELPKVHGQPYSGIVSSHSWADDTVYERIYELGGVVTPHAGGADGFVEKWLRHRAWAEEDFYFGFGFGSDMNGFSRQGGPRGENLPDSVTYPFHGFGGITVDRQHSGPVAGGRTYDINVDGVAHYGLYPDWIENIRLVAEHTVGLGDELMTDMLRGPEAFLQMWERAVGIAPDACRADVTDLTADDMSTLRREMSVRQVLEALGQPSTRLGTEFTYCVAGTGTITLTFKDGTLSHWNPRSYNGF